MVCQDDVRAITAQTDRRPRLEPARQAHVQSWRWPPVVAALPAWRGVPLPVAVTTGVDLGDVPRGESPRQRMPSLGVMPAAYSSGERRRQGASTPAGPTQARRALVEGAWADRSPAQVSRPRPRRLENLPHPRQAISWQAPGRRCPRFRRVMARGQRATQVVVAMARQRPVTPSAAKAASCSRRDGEGCQRAAGRDAAPVWGHPRQRDETRRHHRASMEAGTRRTPVRWCPPTARSRIRRRV
jgi:hypothetical protein